MTEKPKRPIRRKPRGSAWYWKQTDCWYYTPPGTKGREPLRDETGRHIRGAENKHAARLALARVRIQQGRLSKQTPTVEPASSQGAWLVARVCSDYVTRCQKSAAAGHLHPEHAQSIARILNEFCRYCGALPVTELKRGYVSTWVESVPSWRSPVTRRNVITTVLGAFQYAESEHGVRNPLKGLKKPPQRPRLHSIRPEDEQLIYQHVAPAFHDFLFAALHTGLRPFCELAKLTAEHVEETPRGMLWRIHSSKTKKLRKIPVRPEVARLTRKLLKSAPPRSGRPIFRNVQGNPWKKVTGVKYFLQLKRELAWDRDEERRRYSCYSCRHTFAHRMLSGYWNKGVGCSIEVLAELMGDTPKTAYDHYGREWGRHYQDPLWAAIGEGKADEPTTKLNKRRKHGISQ